MPIFVIITWLLICLSPAIGAYRWKAVERRKIALACVVSVIAFAFLTSAAKGVQSPSAREVCQWMGTAVWLVAFLACWGWAIFGRREDASATPVIKRNITMRLLFIVAFLLPPAHSAEARPIDRLVSATTERDATIKAAEDSIAKTKADYALTVVDIVRSMDLTELPAPGPGPDPRASEIRSAEEIARLNIIMRNIAACIKSNKEKQAATWNYVTVDFIKLYQKYKAAR